MKAADLIPAAQAVLALQEDSANRHFQAQRTEEAYALHDPQEAMQRFREAQAAARAARHYEAARLHAIGAASRYDESVAGNYGPTL